jgi:hypothetical protein
MTDDEIDKIINEWLDDLEKHQDTRIYMPGLSGEFGWEHLKDFYTWLKENKFKCDKK